MSGAGPTTGGAGGAPDPERPVNVCVIGGGLAGASTALGIKVLDPDLKVTLLPGPTPAAWGGVLQPGLMDHANRIAQGIGEEAALKIERLTRAGIDRILEVARALGIAHVTGGSVKLATFPVEADDLTETAAMLRRDGIDVELTSADALGTEAPDRPRGHLALYDPLGGWVSASELRNGLLAAAYDSGVKLIEETLATAVEEVGSAVTISLSDGDALRAEVCVLAAGSGSRALHPALYTALLPIRVQGLRAAVPRSVPALRWRGPVTGSWGHETFALDAEGDLWVVGMRPDSQGDDVSDVGTTTPAFQRFLEGFARRRLPGLPEHLPVLERFAGTVALPARGLPLIGPLPGTSRLLVCAGFGFRGHGFAIAAGELLARLIVAGDPIDPSCLRP